MKWIQLLFVCTLFVAFACEEDDSNQDPTYEEGTTFTLGFAETATCACEGPEITLSQVVEDSRCPLNVVCVWEGQVIVGLTIDGSLIELGISPSDQIDSSTTIGNWVVTLQAVNPYPEDGFDELEDEDYEVELLVESL